MGWDLLDSTAGTEQIGQDGHDCSDGLQGQNSLGQTAGNRIAGDKTNQDRTAANRTRNAGTR